MVKCVSRGDLPLDDQVLPNSASSASPDTAGAKNGWKLELVSVPQTVVGGLPER